LTTLGIFTASSIAGESTATADDKVYTVTGTEGEGVWLHGDPGLGDAGDLIKRMPDGAQFAADCYVIDTPIGPRDNPVWLHGQDNRGDVGYFTDYYSDSKWSSDNTLKQQGLPLCDERNVPQNKDTSDSG
jgi:hypothetical protein